MEAIQLYDKYTEEIVGTVLLKEGVDFDQITEAWDEYQETHNMNTMNEPNIYDFVSFENNSELCHVLNIEFYQPE